MNDIPLLGITVPPACDHLPYTKSATLDLTVGRYVDDLIAMHTHDNILRDKTTALEKRCG
jgi:hypothetical protein